MGEMDGYDLEQREVSPLESPPPSSKAYLVIGLIPPIMFAYGTIDLLVIQPNQAASEAESRIPLTFPKAETDAALWNAPFKGYLRSLARVAPEAMFGRPEWYDNTSRRTSIRSSYAQVSRTRDTVVQEIKSSGKYFNRMLVDIGLIVGGITAQYAVFFINTANRLKR